jgi:DNA/RNA-binding domain of Phe-tRNA-synthetase-like protein
VTPMTDKTWVPQEVQFTVDREGLRLALIPLSEVMIEPSPPDFSQFEHSIFEEIRSSYTLQDAKDDPLIRSYRDLYWTFGMDPTKQRVSSEALLRRVLRGENLWRVSNLVDVANLASAYHRLPIGLIDGSRWTGQLAVRQAMKGEVFTRIGGSTIECRGREIVLADSKSIVCFGYATHDSDATKVTNGSKNVLLVLYVSSAVSDPIMEGAISITSKMLRKWVPCELGAPRIFS